MIFLKEENALVAKRQGETLRIEAWGTDSLRVRATMYPQFTGNEWALTERVTSVLPAPATAEPGRPPWRPLKTAASRPP